MRYLDDRHILSKAPMNNMMTELIGICDYIQDSMNKVCKRYSYRLNPHTNSFITILRDVCQSELMIIKDK